MKEISLVFVFAVAFIMFWVCLFTGVPTWIFGCLASLWIMYFLGAFK